MTDTAAAPGNLGCATRWGPWRLDREQRVLAAGAGRQRVAVDLEDLRSPVAVLDALYRLAAAGHDDQAIAGLVRALVDVLRPQASLCSWGRPRNLSRREIRDLAAKAGEPS